MSEQIFYFIQQLLNGLTIGSTYALIAIGYTMVYGIIGMINFALRRSLYDWILHRFHGDYRADDDGH